ncbi:MAG: hypothetical protein AAF675_11080 [Pseudomonadota bacterium]
MNNLSMTRTTRSRAVARFRRERLGRRAGDLEERQRGILQACEKVSDLTTDTTDQMAALRQERSATAQKLRADLHEHNTRLRNDIAGMISQLSRSRDISRRAQLSDLRQEVMRIVTEDFRSVAK